ncbi:hypothetical protein AAH678_02220 [Sodalis endosymbiont of Spalangia cameroni]|uniref:helix-turn-helix domain-containing protein n=1 Tax=Sodalis praecaptivus TaxID=1239307 RepID=UPI0031FA1562
MAKTLKGSFDTKTKEPFSSRLRQLLKGRTVKQAADDWDVNLSTVKNYFSRPDSNPRYDVLSKISNKEGVSIEWLLGEEDSFESKREAQMIPPRGWRDRLIEMLDLLSDAELEAITKQLTLKGVETILYLLDDDNIKLLQLDYIIKEKILGRQPQTQVEAALNNEKARECGLDSKNEAGEEILTSYGKKRAV